MKKSAKRILCAVTAIIILLTSVPSAFAMSEAEWSAVWDSRDANAGIAVFPGADESQRNFSWYTADENTPSVQIGTDSALKGAESFSGTSVNATDGDFANHVTVSGLKENTTYYYQCVSGDYKSEIYSFTTDAESSFTAVYMTDIHVSEDAEDESVLSETAMNFNNTLEDALKKNGDISLILSAGDQASQGLECEYKAFTSFPLIRSMTVATTIGNHDRKGVEYKNYANVPNENDTSKAHSYIGNDYYFVKGDVLFLVTDSGCGNGADHAKFIKNAIEENPDVKWKVLMFHHDPYSGRIPHRESENKLHRLIWGPICDEFGIDLVLAGHSHYYTVSDVLYNNKVASEFESVMTDPQGTVFLVSCSINRPRNDETIGLNEEIGFDYLTDKPVYNVIDFTEDTITVNSYEAGSEEAFNTFSITKTSAEGGHDTDISFFRKIRDGFVRGVGRIYAFFDNIGVYFDLKEDGYELKFFDYLKNT